MGLKNANPRKELQVNTSTNRQKQAKVTPLRPSNNEIPFEVPQTDLVIPIDEMIVNLPEFLETAVSYIVSDFDYENNITSNTATGLRILAVMIDRLNTSLDNCHE